MAPRSGEGGVDEPCSKHEFRALKVQVDALDRLLTVQLKAQDEKVLLGLARVDSQLGGLREKVDDLRTAVSRQLISLLATIVGVLVAALVLAATR